MKNQFLLLVTMAVGIAITTSCDTNELEEPGLLVPLTVDEAASLPSIAVNGTQLHSESFGDPSNPLIVVLHGGPGADYKNLLNCQQFVSEGYFVVFYDQRGTGLSKRHDADHFTTDMYFDDLEAVITHYQGSANQEIFLLGHSWGAMLATGYVNLHPEQITGLILAEPGGLTWDQTEDYITDVQSFDFFGETLNDFVYLDQFITSDQHNTLDYKSMLQIGAADFGNDNNTGDKGPYPVWRSGAIAATSTIDFAEENPFNFTTNLSEYTTKVLFMYSERNKSYGLSHAEAVSAPFPNVQLERIDGTGHELVYFGWNNFYPVVQAYLNDLSNL